MPSNEKQTYPRIPSKNWWDLRQRFVQSPPRQVTTDYLQSVLGIGEGAAKNLVPQLKAIGLIDEQGQPTQLTNDWRSDEHYAQVCEQLLAKLYPQELLDAFPQSDADKSVVAQWFMRKTNTGESAGKAMAAFYLVLKEADPSGIAMGSRGAQPKARARRREPSKGNKMPALQPPEGESPAVTDAPSPLLRQEEHRLPEVHIDIQVHLSPEANLEQIDQVFASMAKHLYRRVSG